MARREDTTKEALASYAAKNGQKVLSIEKDYSVVELRNGSIGKVTHQQVADFMTASNEGNFQRNGKSGNLHQAAHDDTEEILGAEYNPPKKTLTGGGNKGMNDQFKRKISQPTNANSFE